MIESAIEPRSLDPDVLFVVVSALGLALFNWIVAVFLPDRFWGAWLTTMAVGQLGMGGLLFLGVQTDPSNDIGNVFGRAFATLFVMGGSSAAAMLAAVWLFDRTARKRKA